VVAKKLEKKSPSNERVSFTMSRVRSSGSVIETKLGQALWAAGFRYRKQYPIFGRPDFVIVKDRIAIFCDSEFWHGYRWGTRRKAEHKTNQSYWFAKIERNRARDRAVNRRLYQDGWTVIRFWERDINEAVQACVERVLALRARQQVRRTL
jgi:DNA mismatch endonuclease (patch repair protein)